MTTRITKRHKCHKCKTSQKLRLSGRFCRHPYYRFGVHVCTGTGLKPRLSGAARRKLARQNDIQITKENTND